MSVSESILRRGGADYPSRLLGVRGAPDCLHLRGALVPTERAVAIVGARAARQRDVEAAYRLASELARAGIYVVSGGALGVDAAAHRGALDAAHPGRPALTAAVFGCGLSIAYPARNRSLFEDIYRAGGALLSEFPDVAQPRAWHFVRRNKTMAGMTDAVLVVAAGAQSGSLHTAR
ncbi:MAG: DNA-processing protein DprA, partial [Myxococcota bacterium]